MAKYLLILGFVLLGTSVSFSQDNQRIKGEKSSTEKVDETIDDKIRRVEGAIENLDLKIEREKEAGNDATAYETRREHMKDKLETLQMQKAEQDAAKAEEEGDEEVIEEEVIEEVSPE